MSDAARLASQSFSRKPKGTVYRHFAPSVSELSSINSVMADAAIDSSYAAVITYAEAISGIQKGSISWSVIRLYYSCFYSLRALLLLSKVVPFNSKGEMLLDAQSGKFLKGGTSSHHWNWNSIRKIAQIRGDWFVSEDSEDAYAKLRQHRENVNYTHSFTDPSFHSCLVSGELDIAKRFRSYRDDAQFLYTYLADHLAIAYPTKLIFSLDASLKGQSLSLPQESIKHANSIWSVKARCPGL